jgi:hypothetical protein
VHRGTRELRPGRPYFFAYGAITLYGPPSQVVRLRYGFLTPREVRGPLRLTPTTPLPQRPRAFTWQWFRLFPFRSPLLRESMTLFFPPGTEMFHFPRCRFTWVLGFNPSPSDDLPYQQAGFPHSGILGSQPICGSPRLIAAYHALHRLPLPRHPPATLSSLVAFLL